MERAFQAECPTWARPVMCGEKCVQCDWRVAIGGQGRKLSVLSLRGGEGFLRVEVLGG